MALTIPQLAVALRLIGAEDESVPAGVTSILTRQAAVARALVTAQAPTAPDDVADEAVVRLVGFLFDQSPGLPRANNPMVASGAGAVLAPWHVSTVLFPSGAAPAAGAGAGVDTARVEALISAAVEMLRQVPAGGADGQFLGHAEGAPAWTAAPPAGSISPAERRTIDGAVQLSSVTLEGNELAMSNAGGMDRTLTLRQVPDIQQADANKVLKVDSGGTTADWRDDETGSGGGLSQSQVDARVTALRPRPVPAYGAGDAGEVLTVASGGQSIRWAPAAGAGEGGAAGPDPFDVLYADTPAYTYEIATTRTTQAAVDRPVGTSSTRLRLNEGTAIAPRGRKRGKLQFKARLRIATKGAQNPLFVDGPPAEESHDVVFTCLASDVPDTHLTANGLAVPGIPPFRVSDSGGRRYTAGAPTMTLKTDNGILEYSIGYPGAPDSRNLDAYAALSLVVEDVEVIWRQDDTENEGASGNTFPTDVGGQPVPVGHRFDLLAQQTVPYPVILTAGDQGSGAQGRFGWYQGFGHVDLDGAGVDGVLWYGSESGNPVALRGRLAVWRAAGESRTPTAVVVAGTTHALTATPGLAHVWRSAAVGNPFTSGTAYAVQVLYGSAKNWPDRTYEPREYIWTGGRWIPWEAFDGADVRDLLQSLTGDARLNASAVRGLPQPKFERLLVSGPGSGLTVTNVGQGVTSAAVVVGDPAFDLDDEGQGELDLEAVFHVASRGSINLGLTDDRFRVYRVTDIVFASTLAALGTFDSSTPVENTVTLGDPVDVYDGSTKVGELVIRLGHNAAGQLLYVVRYDPVSQSASTTNWALALGLSIAFSPTDVSGDELPASTADDAGDVLTVSASGAPEWQAPAAPEAPGGGGGGETLTLIGTVTVSSGSGTPTLGAMSEAAGRPAGTGATTEALEGAASGARYPGLPSPRAARSILVRGVVGGAAVGEGYFPWGGRSATHTNNYPDRSYASLMVGSGASVLLALGDWPATNHHFIIVEGSTGTRPAGLTVEFYTVS